MPLIYGTQRPDGAVNWRNARGFDGPIAGVDLVLLDGEFPEIRAAYEGLNIEVRAYEAEKPKPRRRARR